MWLNVSSIPPSSVWAQPRCPPLSRLSPLLQGALGGICLFMLPKLLLRKLLWLKRALEKRSASTLVSQGPPDQSKCITTFFFLDQDLYCFPS